MSQLGRISGPLLKANLLRQGVDLAFETDLLYLDVNNLRVGIKTNSPTHDLTVNGTTKTTNLEVINQLDVANLTFNGNTISTTQSTINIVPSGGDPVVYNSKLIINDITIQDNVISTNVSNSNLELRPNGTGIVEIFSDTQVYGNIHATGNITADGDITIGDEDTDNIVFNADIASNIIPNLHNTYTLGSADKKWADVWTENLTANTITTGDLIIDGINITLPQGNIIYVATSGDDSKSGTHQNDPFATIKHALSEASAGDTVYIYPGEYTEQFPLTVPVGVTIKGVGLRSVKIVPTVGTIDKDAFLLNGENTIEDLTVANFRYNLIDDTGYAFRFANNITVTSRSPYIRNVTVLTKGSIISESDPLGFDQGDAGRGAKADGSVANASSNEASMLFHSVTFVTPNADTIVLSNGVRIEWLNSFIYYANRGIYAVSGTTGFAGQGRTQLRFTGVNGLPIIGDEIRWYDTDGTTILASGSLIEIDGTDYYLSGNAANFATGQQSSGKTVIANGTAKLSTSIKKFGSASLELAGDGDYAFVQSTTDFEFGTNDFTLEFWLYPTALTTQRNFLDFRTASNQAVPVIYIIGSTYFAAFFNALHWALSGHSVIADFS
jgi:hypothetical protein